MNNENTNRAVFIEGDNLLLCPQCEEDAERNTMWINDPQVRKYLTTRKPITLMEGVEWIKNNSKSNKDVVFAVVKKDNMEHIGNMGLHNINPITGTATFGFMIGEKRYWKNGHGTEMLKLMLEYAFNTLGLQRMESSALSPNKGSVEIHKRCGFRVVGILKKKHLVEGEYLDETLFEILREDWVKIKK